MSNASWTLAEFKNISFGDKRLDRRFNILSSQLAALPSSPINKASEDWASTKAAYRFFDNEKITSKKILNPHMKNTIERCSKYPFVLAVQDSSSFNYTNHYSKNDFGLIGSGSKSETATESKGLYIHPTLALSPQGLPLGLLSNFFWKREKKEEINSYKDGSESARWVESLEECHENCCGKVKFISVADRECDFNEFFLKCIDTDNHFIVRSRAKRKILESGDDLHVFASKLPIMGELQLEIQNKKGTGNRQVKKHLKGRFKNKDEKLTRIVNLNLQYSPVHIILHSGQRNRADIDLKISVVRLFEDRPKESLEEGEHLIEWILLTSLEVTTRDLAETVADFYHKRWTIETYFKIFKSGCNVEDCRLKTYDRLVNYLTLFSIIAWRISWMTFIQRVNPSEDCTAVLSAAEWKSLYCKIHKTPNLPEKVPTVREVVVWIARLGGFLARKNDGNPGSIVIWRGWQRLTDLANMWEVIVPNI